MVALLLNLVGPDSHVHPVAEVALYSAVLFVARLLGVTLAGRQELAPNALDVALQVEVLFLSLIHI